MRNINMARANITNKDFNYKGIIFMFFVLLFLFIAYIWSHIHMRQLEYRLASEISKKEELQEEQKRLKVEHNSLKSSKRIEAIAVKELKMYYPKREQVISLQ